MNSIAPMRWVAALFLLGGGMAYGQSTLPPMSPTFAERVTHPASVAYAHGELEVRADNSSLNQILRDISRQMGMKIVGS